MLAGRKLLLADDSVTIQKVIELTFADEGVKVVAVGGGQEAIEKLVEPLPDIVLADVFMPGMNGYEVCEYIKKSEKLRHIPVILLVGSFEPFNEAEARRAGADDTLTKPFQSIRRLIDKVSHLVSGGTPEQEISTAELPKAVNRPAEPELTAAQLEITTADTEPLPAALRHKQPKGTERGVDLGIRAMESQTSEPRGSASTEPNDTPLDLGEFAPMQSFASDDFELDIDLEESDDAEVPAYASSPVAELHRPESRVDDWGVARTTAKPSADEPSFVEDRNVAMYGQVVPHSPGSKGQFQEQGSYAKDSMPRNSESGWGSAPVPSQLSPEVIDAIARRAVERLSEKVIQEIAWEVVPQLAELLIKRRLEEKESQPK